MKPVLWNTLDSIDEVLNSRIGPDVIVRGPNVGFAEAQHGTGFVRTARDTHLEIPSSVLHGLEDAGTIEMWINPLVSAPKPYEYGIFGLAGRPYSWAWAVPTVPETPNIELVWGDGVSARGLRGGVGFDSTPGLDVFTRVESTQFVAAPGVPFHVALVWDVTGIDGSADTLRVYRDGAAVGASQTVWSTQNTYWDPYNIWLGYGPDAEGFNRFVTDDVIVWDAAVTDFSGRFTPGPDGGGEPPTTPESLVLWDSFNDRAPFARAPGYSQFSYAADFGGDAIVRTWEPGEWGNGAPGPSQVTFDPAGGYFGGGAAFNYSGSDNGYASHDEIVYAIGDQINANGGAIEFWYRPFYNSNDELAVMYLFETKSRIDQPSLTYNEAQVNGMANLQLSYFGWGGRKYFYAAVFDTGGDYIQAATPDEYSPDRFTFDSGDWMHMALVWDGDGMAHYGDKTLAVFIDGVEVASSTRYFQTDVDFDDYLILGGAAADYFQINTSTKSYSGASGAFDNIKIWDYAKIDYSDRFVEGVGPVVLFAEDFSGILSDAWEVKLDAARIEDGWLHLRDDDGWPRNAVVVLKDSDPSWTDYSVRMKADFADGTPWDNFAVVLRADGYETSSDGHYGSGYFINVNGVRGWDAPNRSQIELFRFVAPDLWNRQLIEVAYDLPADGAEFIFAVEGGRIRAWADGALLFDVTDPDPLPFGGLGLHTIWESHARFDDVLVVAGSPEAAGWLSSPPPPPPVSGVIGLGRTEAETLKLGGGFSVEANVHASQGAWIRAIDPSPNDASGAFDGPAGLYAITVGYMDETDGESEMAIRVNGVEVDAWVWDGAHGDAIATAVGRAERATFGVALNPGDTIAFVGTGDGGEPLRTDWIEIAPTPLVGLGRTEAETLAQVGFFEGTNPHASGGSWLQAEGDREAKAAFVFDGEAGLHDLTIGYFDESDGASTMKIAVNGEIVHAWAWDADAGSAIAAPSSRAEHVAAALALAPGDLVELIGQADGGEPLRTDWIEIAPLAVWADPADALMG